MEKEQIGDDMYPDVDEHNNNNDDDDDDDSDINEEQTREEVSAAPDEHKDDEPLKVDSSKLVVYSVVVIILLIVGLVYYNQYFTNNGVDSFKDISGGSVKGVVEDSYFYKDTEFKLIDNLWYFTLFNSQTQRSYNIPLHFGPRDVIDVPMIGAIDTDFFENGNVYITFVPEEEASERMAFITLASVELTFNLKQAFNVNIVSGCAENISYPCDTMPIITCGDKDKSVIFLNYDDETKVEFKDNCILIQGKEKDLTKAVDRLLLGFYGLLDY